MFGNKHLSISHTLSRRRTPETGTSKYLWCSAARITRSKTRPLTCEVRCFRYCTDLLTTKYLSFEQSHAMIPRTFTHFHIVKLPISWRRARSCILVLRVYTYPHTRTQKIMISHPIPHTCKQTARTQQIRRRYTKATRTSHVLDISLLHVQKPEVELK